MKIFKFQILLGLLFFNLSFSNDLINPLSAGYSINVTASDSSDYTLSGTDLNGSVSGDDPALTFIVGDAITFSVNASGHPFYIKTQAGTGTDNQASGVTNNGAESGDVVWNPTASGTYYYQCSAHADMVGTITVKAKVSSISLDETTINEAGATSTLTATLSTAHFEDVIIPLTITGTASLEDYSTDFATKGIKTVAGGNGEGNALNQLDNPYDVHSDNIGNIYIADHNNSRIVKWEFNASQGVELISSISDLEALHVDNSGNIYVVSGNSVIKYSLVDGSYSASTVAGGNGGGNALNQLNDPKGIDLDSSGNIYIADASNNRIMKWIPGATEGVIVAQGNDSTLNYPRDVAVDSSGNLYIADWNNQRVMKWIPGANEGSSIYGYIYYPMSVEIDDFDNVYVVQHYSHVVKKYLKGTTTNPLSIIGNGNQGSSESSLKYPWFVHVSNSGDVYVADNENNRIQKLKVNPEIKIESGDTTGTVTFSSLSDFDDEEDETIIITPSTSVTNATSTITDASTITITDNDDPPSVSFALSFPTINENSSSNVTLTATLSRVSGKSIEIPYTVGGTATENTEFTVSSSPITIPAGSTTGTMTISTNGLDDSDVEPIETIILTFGTLVNVTSTETDVTLNLLSDDKPTVDSLEINATTIEENGSTSTITATLSEVHSRNVIIPLTITGTATLDQDYETEFSSKGATVLAGGNGYGNALNQLDDPYSVSVDSSGNIYVADFDNNRIVKWVPGSNQGENIINVSTPNDIHVDSSGNIYVSSYYNHRVFKYTLSNGSYTQSTVAGTGSSGPALNQLSYAEAIFVDSSNNIYIADTRNFRVVKWEPGSSEGLVVAGGNGEGTGLNQLSWPRGITLDSVGNFYVSDTNNNRIMKWTPSSSEGILILEGISEPRGIHVDSSDNIFISNHNSANVLKCTLINGSYTPSVVAGSNGSGSNLNQLSGPIGIYIDDNGNIYIADRYNHRIIKQQIKPEIEIVAGSNTGAIKFRSLADLSDEDDETIIVTPSTSVSNATSSITDTKTITITDDDVASTVSFAFSSPNIDEDSSSDVTLTANLNEPSGREIKIPYTIGGTATETTEFTVSSSPITIPAGSTTGTVTISTNGLDDTDVEPIETIILTFGTLINATTTETDVTLNLLSDDKPTVDAVSLDTETIAEDGSTSTITATISAAHSRDVKIPLVLTGTAQKDSDYSIEFASRGASTVAGGNGEGNSLNQLRYPRGVVVDSSGNIYIADTDNSRIMKWTPGATKGEIIITGIYPMGIHVDNSGNIFVSDYNGHRVLKYTLSSGSYTQSVIAGGNNSGNSLNQLNRPFGIYVDSSETVYVADSYNHRIMKWSSGASQGVLVAGGNNQGNALNQLDYPRSVNVDSSGNIYVSDSDNNRIMKWAPNSNQGVELLSIYHPREIKFDSQKNLYVVTHYSEDILKYPIENGTYSNSKSSSFKNEFNNGNLNYPNGMYIDEFDNIYVADRNNQRVEKLQLSPEIIVPAGSTTGIASFKSILDNSDEDDETIIVTPNTSVSNATSAITDASTITITDDDDAPTVSFALSSPSIDENSSSAVTLTATLNIVSGKSIEIPYTVGGTATESTEFTVSSSPITIPAGLTTGTATISTNGLDDADVEPIETIILTFGTLVNATTTETDITLNLLSDDKPTVDSFTLDTGSIAENGEVSSLTATISAVHSKDVTIPLTITGTATINVDYTTEFVDKGLVTTVAGGNGQGNSANQLRYPHGLGMDSSGNIYVADTDNSRIMKWTPGASEGISIITGIYTLGIYVDDLDNIFVSDYNNNRVLKYTLSDGSYTQSVVAGGNNSGSNLNQLNRPFGIYVDSSENVYVTDRENHRIMKWPKGSSEGIVVAGGNGRGNSLNQLNYPYDVSLDSSNNIYVADESNYRIMRWAPNSSEGVIIAGGNYGNGLSELRYPRGVELNSDGVMFITDSENHRIIKWIPGKSSGTVIAGGNGNGNNMNQLNSPWEALVGSDGNLYVADRNNHRIQKVDLNSKIVIKAGSISSDIKFTSINDSSYEFDETIIVTPSNSPTNATSSYSDPYNVTIVDDSEPPTVTFSLSSAYINENSPTDVLLTASMSSVAGRPIEIPFTLSGTATETTEYTVSSNSINILEGSNKGSITISTNGLDDTTVETVETIIFTYGTIVNANSTETETTLNLLSDDNPTLNSVEYSKTSFAEHESVKISATISESHSKDITIPISLSGSSKLDVDYSVEFFSKEVPSLLFGQGQGWGLNQLSRPKSFTNDDSGNIYVGDENSRIIKIKAGSTEGEAVINNISGPYGVQVDSNGYIYVTEHHQHRVLKYTLNGDSYIFDAVVAGGNGGGSNLNQLYYPSQIYLDSSDNLYVVDSQNHRIVRWSPGATEGIVVAGGNGPGNELNQLRYPSDLSVDPNGTIYISDWDNRRIVKWEADANEGEIIYYDNNNYYGNYMSIEVDQDSGVIYSTDFYNNSVYRFIPLDDGKYKRTIIAGGNGSGNNLNQLNNPKDVLIDSDNNLNILDENNHRIIKVQLSPEIMIKSGSTKGDFTITGFEDRVDEGDETIIVTPSLLATNVITEINDATTLSLLDNTISLVQKDDPFLGLSKSSVSWGDFDNDGDKDVAIMGVSNVDGAFNDIYRNNEGSFARMNQNFVNLYDGDLSWVDLNKDGYLDLVVSGYNETPQINAYISKNNAQFFERSENTYGLPELFASKMAWGDLDNDGDIDLAISGIDAQNNNVFHIYYRENGKDNFVRETQFNGSVASNGFLEIVDIDLDGDNDIKFPGGININSFFRSEYNPWYNDGGGNKNSSLGFFKISGAQRLEYIQMGEDGNGNIQSNASQWGINLKLKNGDIAIGDYDNNGLDDIVFTGEDENGVPVTKLFEGISNYAGFQWVESSIELVGLRESTADWVDYDMDGDLDLFITGLDSNSARTILYETEITNKDNQAPPKVTGLKAEDLGNGKIKFSWDTPSDDFSNNIGYVLRLGTTPGGTELSNTFSNLETGNRLITLPPPIYSNSYETSLEPGTYYFAVQAIDGGLKAGEFSDESSYTLKYEWKLLNQGGIVDRKIQSYENPVMKVGDIDNDNDLDLIYGTNDGSETRVYTYNGVRLVQEDGNGYARNIRNSRNITDIDIDDINSDGLSDIVINSFANTNNSQLRVYFGSETGNMEERGIDSGLYKGKVKIIDMNNDGQSEVVLIGLTADNTSGKPKIYIYEMNSDRSFVKVDISEQIDDLTGASYDLGDVDNDQDIDILISGFDESQGLKAYIYKNVGNAGLDYKLEKTTNNIAAIRDGTVDFIDFDSDGDLDAAVTGTGLQGDIFEIYKNDLNEGKENWPRIDLGLTGMRNGKTDLGDFNGDGFTDIIYSGLLEGSGKVTKLAEYTSATNSYVDSAFDVSDVIEASVEFGDIDGDGDLDFVLSGEDKDGLSNNYDPWNNSKYIFRAYLNKRNESAAVSEPQSGSRSGASVSNSYVENAPPSVPEIISTEILLSEQTVEGNLVIEFSWDASSDDLTPVEGLTYALKIGTTENGEEIMSANSNANGQRKTAEKGNAEHNLKWKVSLPDGVYYWSVQAIDASFNGSEFSKPRQFLASSDFKLGDSNGDQSVNILDLTNIIDKILGNDVSVWINTTSDINNDGVIDVLDVSGVVNLILNSNETGLAYGVDPVRNLNYFSTVPVGEMELIYSGNKVYFESEEVISGLQFTINKSIDHLINKDLNENLNIISFKEDYNNITYIIYSNDNQSIADYSNVLLSYVDKKLKEYEISDIKAATPDGLPLIVKYKDESFFDEENEILKVYPNPTKNNLNILGSIVNDLNIIDVKIYNTIGVIVYEESFDSIERFRQLDLSSLISGVYVIEINTILGKNIKKTKVYKFVKN